MAYLRQKYRFKENSKLHQVLAEYCYIALSCPVCITVEDKDYVLQDIATAFFYFVKALDMYDVENPSIIILDEHFERAMRVKSFHVGDSLRWLEAHLEKLYEFSSDSLLHKLLISAVPALFSPGVLVYPEAEITAYLQGLFKEERMEMDLNIPLPPSKKRPPTLPIGWGSPFSIAAVAQGRFREEDFNKEGRFLVKPHLLEFMRQIADIDPAQEVFKYSEVKSIFAHYLRKNKALFLDPRNNTIAHIEGTPLGDVLGVRAFHRNQTWALIASHLIEMRPDGAPETFKKPLDP